METVKIEISKSEQDIGTRTFFHLIYDQYLTNAQKYRFTSAPAYIISICMKY